jgi:hypothetical protein
MAIWTKTAREIIAAGTSNAATATTRGRLALTTADGGLLTVKLTNGGTGPTIQAVANILIAHNASQPAAGAAGADWKTLYSVGNGVTANTIGEWAFEIPAAVMQLEVEVTGNTGQAVVCEAYLSEKTSFA